MTLATNIKLIGSELGSDNALFRKRVGLSHFHHDFAMFFLDPQVRKKSREQFVQALSGYISFVDRAAIKVLSFLRHNFFPIMNAQKFLKPFHNGFINRGKLKHGSMYDRINTCFSFDGIDVKTSVPVDVASEISKVQFFHKYSFSTVYANVEYRSTVNDLASKILRDMRKSDLIGDYERECRRTSPPVFAGQKSNRLPVLNSAAARLGQALRETQDALQRDNLESSASVINCVGGSNGDIPTEMNITDVDDVFTILQNNSGEYITNIVEAELRFGTSPIGDAYGCMATTRMIPVFYNMSGFIKKFQYPNISQTLSVEIGGANNVRFFVSEQGSVTPNASLLGNDIANCFVSAKEGYKVVWQAGGKAKFIYLPPGYNNDPCIKYFNVHVKSEVIDLETYELAA